tara:strand:+ start:232 stop:426 length:195 start_codon:yes stop_codon:yes gene_type:complete
MTIVMTIIIRKDSQIIKSRLPDLTTNFYSRVSFRRYGGGYYNIQLKPEDFKIISKTGFDLPKLN